MKIQELLKILLCFALIYFACENSFYTQHLCAYTLIKLNEYHLVLGLIKKVLAIIMLCAAGFIASSCYDEMLRSHPKLDILRLLLLYLTVFPIVILGIWNLLLWPACYFFISFDVSQLFNVVVELFNSNKHPTGNDNSMLASYFSILELLLSALIIVVGVFYKKFRNI
jgi:hypothetical protein